MCYFKKKTEILVEKFMMFWYAPESAMCRWITAHSAPVTQPPVLERGILQRSALVLV